MPRYQGKEQQLLQVTDRALMKLSELLADQRAEPGQGLALIPVDDVLNISLAHPSAEDQVVEQDGEPVVIVPRAVAEQFEGWVLDYQNDTGSEQFTFEPPDNPGFSPNGLAPT